MESEATETGYIGFEDYAQWKTNRINQDLVYHSLVNEKDHNVAVRVSNKPVSKLFHLI